MSELKSLCGNSSLPIILAEVRCFSVRLLLRALDLRELAGASGPIRNFGFTRHIRVRFNAVTASVNSTATLVSPRKRNRRIPRCSFSTPITGSTISFRRRYTARPAGERSLRRMR